jgi:hypothetical protein
MEEYPFGELAKDQGIDEYVAAYQTRWLPRRAPSPRYP